MFAERDFPVKAKNRRCLLFLSFGSVDCCSVLLQHTQDLFISNQILFWIFDFRSGEQIAKYRFLIFISEILINCIKNESPDKSLFFFLEKSLFVLDTSKRVNNFIIIFLLNLSKYLGFYPNVNSSGNYFNLYNGIFENQKSDNYSVNEFNSIIIKKFESTFKKIPNAHTDLSYLIDLFES